MRRGTAIGAAQQAEKSLSTLQLDKMGGMIRLRIKRFQRVLSWLLAACTAGALLAGSNAAALTNSIQKGIVNGQLSIAINFKEWSGDFQYELRLPASECLPVTLAASRHCLQLGERSRISLSPTGGASVNSPLGNSEFVTRTDQPVLGEQAGSYWAPSADIVVTLSPTNSSSIDRRCTPVHLESLLCEVPLPTHMQFRDCHISMSLHDAVIDTLQRCPSGHRRSPSGTRTHTRS